MTNRFLRALSLLAIASLASAQESVDLDVVHRIRQEALQNSKVMDHLFQLTEVSGPRLTNSPGFFKAADWVTKQMKDWGMEAHQESWGPFGRGWEFTRFSAQIVEPVGTPMIGVPMAWTPGTDGKVSGEVIVATMANVTDFARYRDRLKGKIVFMGTGRDLALSNAPVGTRYTDQELAALAIAGPGRGGRGGVPGTTALNTGRGGRGGGPNGGPPNGGPPNAAPALNAGRPNGGGGQNFNNELNKFLVDQEVAVVVRNGGNGSEGGLVFTANGGPREKDAQLPPPTVFLATEHYNRVLRLLDAGTPVKMAFDIEAKFFDDRTDSVNVIAALPGGSKRDQVVMIGAHLDSWHGGTGATDNAAGSAVMIEALRILKDLKLPMDRTVRMALWSGEEQGLLGSRAYVKEHFVDLADMKTKQEHATLSGYFNVDNGSGKIRGIYMQGNDRMRPIFEAWLKPFADMGATTVSIRDTGGTDHQSFDAAGLPGFQFIQDRLDYNTRTHHSNMDVYDRVQREDLQQMAAIVASFVYNAATRPELLPREPLPAPVPGRGGRGGGPPAN